MFQLKSRKPGLTPLASAPPAPVLATIAERQLRILSPPHYAEFMSACHRGFTEDLSFASRRLPNLRFEASAELDGTEHLTVDFGDLEAVVKVGSHENLNHRSAIYHRLSEISPFLNYASTQINFGRVGIDLSDIGSPDRVSFSGQAGAPLMPDCSFLATTAYERERAAYKTAPPWRERSTSVLWRGATTGLHADWRDLPRTRLCWRALQGASALQLDFGFTSIAQVFNASDIAAIEASGLMRPWVPSQRFGEYRYHLDIDSNTNSWPGFFTKLLSGGTVFKVQSPLAHTQWYYPRLEAWRHYIPISSDLSDLENHVSWAHDHPERAEQIAADGQSLARTMTIETEADFGVSVIRSVLAATGSTA